MPKIAMASGNGSPHSVKIILDSKGRKIRKRTRTKNTKEKNNVRRK